MPTPELTCPLCHGTSLTPITRVREHHSAATLEFAVKGSKSGVFGRKTKSYAIRRARACLSCGHVMMALWEDDLEALKKDFDGLEAELT